MRARSYPVSAIIVMAGVLATSPAAHAQVSAQAEQLFRDGRRLIADHKYAEACAAFDASQRIEPLTTTALNLADCYEKNGQLATAWGVFLDVAAKTRTAADAAALHATATRRAEALEPRLSHLTIQLADAARVDGLVIALDHAALATGAWNRGLPVDGGDHTIEVTAPGRVAWSTHVTVGAEHDAPVVTVPALASAAPAVVAAPAPRAAEPAIGAEQPRRMTLPITLGAVAVVALTSGLLLERSAEHTYDRSRLEPDDARQSDLYDSAVHRRAGAIAIGAAGVVAGGLAVYLWLRPRAPAPHVTMMMAPDHVAVAGVF